MQIHVKPYTARQLAPPGRPAPDTPAPLYKGAARQPQTVPCKLPVTHGTTQIPIIRYHTCYICHTFLSYGTAVPPPRWHEGREDGARGVTVGARGVPPWHARIRTSTCTQAGCSTKYTDTGSTVTLVHVGTYYSYSR